MHMRVLPSLRNAWFLEHCIHWYKPSRLVVAAPIDTDSITLSLVLVRRRSGCHLVFGGKPSRVDARSIARDRSPNNAGCHFFTYPITRSRHYSSRRETPDPSRSQDSAPLLSMESSINASESNVEGDEIDVVKASEKARDVTNLPVDYPGATKNEEPQMEESAIKRCGSTEGAPLAADVANAPSSPPLSKKALKRKRRWDEKLAVKKRRKEHAREAKRAKAILDGRDVEKERRDIEERTREGEGRKRREKVRIANCKCVFAAHLAYHVPHKYHVLKHGRS